MIVRVAPFARIRDIVGAAAIERSMPDGATVAECFATLLAEFPDLGALEASTRFVRGAAFVDRDTVLSDGDELGLLPPFGGG